MKPWIVGAALVFWAPAVLAAGELDGLSGIESQLGSADEAQAEAAAQKLAQSTDPKALDAILDALVAGAPPGVQGALLDGLATRHDPRALPVLGHYARNRNPELRKKAIVAIAALPAGEGRALPLLLDALSDQEPEVRAAAAAALGQRHEHAAVDKLIALLARGDAAAAPALAQLATPELARRIGGQLGRIPDALLCTALGEMLKRPDFGPDPVRIEVVRTLSRVPGADSTAALVEYLAASEKDKARPSRTVAQKIVDQRSGN